MRPKECLRSVTNSTTGAASTEASSGQTSWFHSRAAAGTALVLGNVALALGPWSVRLADSGPVSAGFWRLFLALPFLALIARRNGETLAGLRGSIGIATAAAGVLFAFDLASWHIGIEATRLGNSTLFGNSGSLILMVWGIIAMRRGPRAHEIIAITGALAGAAILMGRSLEIDSRSLVGDLFCVMAGFFYAFYILLLQKARDTFGGWTLLFYSSLAGAPILLIIALLLGEPVWPHNWGPLIALMLLSQIIGQGLLVYSLRHFTPLVIGLALLTQPAVSALTGWLAFNETLTWLDAAGMLLVAASLAVARRGDR